MSTSQALPGDDPRMIAWAKYTASEEYKNSFKWAENERHRDGSMWGAFICGWNLALAAAKAPDAGAWIATSERMPEDRWAHTEKLLMDERVLRLAAESRLAQAVELLSSALQIAGRKGRDTNWEAFNTGLLQVLHANNRNGITPRTFYMKDDA